MKNYTNHMLETLRKKVPLPFVDNIWGAYLADMQLTNFNKDICF